jgi:urease accessory protein
VQVCSHARIGSGGRLIELDTRPPLTLRRVGSEPAVCGLCLVGTAAGPLAGDDLVLSLDLDAGANVRLQATGAAIAQGRAGGGGAAARLELRAALGRGSRLQAAPGPLVVCAGARVDVAVRLDLAVDAHLDWSELLVLGRSGESGGAVTVRWAVQRGGRPLLRQLVDLADPALRTWPGMTGGQRVLASRLVCGPGIRARTIVHGRSAVAQAIAADAALLTVLGPDAVTVRDALEELNDDLRRGPTPPGPPSR